MLDATEAEPPPPCPPTATRAPGRRPAMESPLGVLRGWSGGGLPDAAGAAAAGAAAARGRRLGGSAAADDVLCPFRFIFQSVSTLSENPTSKQSSLSHKRARGQDIGCNDGAKSRGRWMAGAVITMAVR